MLVEGQGDQQTKYSDGKKEVEQKVENIQKWDKGRKRVGWNTNHVDTRTEKEGLGQCTLSDGYHRDQHLKLGMGRATEIFFPFADKG